jgi:acyl-CoA reductase-like NAD-dependent aldehyde dehydrogenase
MTSIQKTISPADGSICVERPLAGAAEIDAALARAVRAAAAWRATPIEERSRLLTAAVDAFVADKERIAAEITLQMGRPIAQSPGEVRGFEERARHMIAIAGKALADIPAGAKPGFNRFIRREPHGVVFVMAPWNYPS